MQPTSNPYVSPVTMQSDTLKSELLKLHKPARVRFIYKTTPTWLTVKNNPFRDITIKRSLILARINVDYAELVNRERANRGESADFVPSKRKWGERVWDTSVVEHGEKSYMEAIVEEVLTTCYIDTTSNTVIPFDLIKDWLKPREDRAVPLCDYNLEGISHFVVVEAQTPRGG